MPRAATRPSIRDVAAHANVALGSIYRYFVGKDHLLAAALVQWAHDLSAASA